MSIRSMLVAAAFAVASLAAAHADGLRPIDAKSIDLGEVSGVAYYTVERDGFHVVTTLAQGGRERRSVSCLFLHRVRVWLSQLRTRQVRSKSAGTATACSSTRRNRDLRCGPPGPSRSAVRQFCRSWKNQTEVTVPGSHFFQEIPGPSSAGRSPIGSRPIRGREGAKGVADLIRPVRASTPCDYRGLG